MTSAGAPAGSGGWESRPLLSGLVRLVAHGVPLAFSVATAVVLSHVVRRPSGAALIVWWLGLILGSTIALLLADRLFRRLLPLAALLKLSLVFPDKTPSRFSVALRAGSTRQLERRLEAMKERRDANPDDAAEAILALVASLSAHDRKTRGHCERVRALAELLGSELRLTDRERERLRWAALLHDIGKMRVPTSILNKDGKPDEQEWEQLRRHPAEGARLIGPLRGWLGDWGPAVEQHHERWDGTGYPAGLKGEQICLGARIVAIADVFDVMTSGRAYKRASSTAKAREELARCAGTQFDPAMVRAFLNISIGRLRLAMGPLSWLAQQPLIGAVPQVGDKVIAGSQAAASTAASAGAAATGVAALALGGGVAPAERPVQPTPAMQVVDLDPSHTSSSALDGQESRHVGPTTTSTTALPPPPPPPPPGLAPQGDDPAPEPTPAPTRDDTPAPVPPAPAPTDPEPTDPKPTEPTDPVEPVPTTAPGPAHEDGDDHDQGGGNDANTTGSGNDNSGSGSSNSGSGGSGSGSSGSGSGGSGSGSSGSGSGGSGSGSGSGGSGSGG